MKKGQIWYMDLLIAMIIVSFAIMLLMSFIGNTGDSDSFSSYLETDAIYISESLMSIGSPINWNESSVTRIGLTNGNWRLNDSKINQLYSFSVIQLRPFFDINSNFLIQIFDDTNILSFSGTNFSGKQFFNPNHISSITRYAIYNSTVVELRVSTWD